MKIYQSPQMRNGWSSSEADFLQQYKISKRGGGEDTNPDRRGNNAEILIIVDNGRGIPEEEIGRIFDKGFTGSNGREEDSHATGMGLYLCSRLCQKLGLGISCESEKGKYTRIILHFPILTIIRSLNSKTYKNERMA